MYLTGLNVQIQQLLGKTKSLETAPRCENEATVATARDWRLEVGSSPWRGGGGEAAAAATTAAAARAKGKDRNGGDPGEMGKRIGLGRLAGWLPR